MRRIILSSFLLPLLLAGCQSNSTGANRATTPAPAPIPLPVTTVQRENLPVVVNLTGTVNALPNKSVKISPAVAGKLVEVSVDTGDSVTARQQIAQLDPSQVTDGVEQAQAGLSSAQAGTKQAQAELEFARQNLERSQLLYKEKILAKKDLTAAQNQVEVAQAKLESARSQEQQARAALSQANTQVRLTKVTSPISGTVAQLFLSVGDTADPNTPIAQIVDLATVMVNANLPPDQQANLQIGQTAKITSQANPDRTILGTVEAVSPTINPQTNAVDVKIKATNTQGLLREGQIVTTAITTAIEKNVLTVPQTALVPDSNNPQQQMVYTVENSKIKRVPVKTGVKAQNRVEITQGLKVSQKIVKAGAYGLPDDTLIQAEAANPKKP